MVIEGKTFFCDDYTNTDVMAPGRYDPIEGREELSKIALIDYPSSIPFVNPSTNRSDYKIIVAGRDFGCGSSRETAPLALHAAGVRAVVAESFARIFFRNCINMGGIYPIQISHNFNENIVNKFSRIDLKNQIFELDNQEFYFSDFGPLMNIINAGGLANHTKKNIEENIK